MTLTAPKLDDRRFQDLVDEAKKRIPYYCKDWTDHNVSDPGVTLIELFAWMVDLLLYRLNQVPDLHYIKFLEMLGVRLNPPIPATAPITFWLTAPPEQPITIPTGTEVASTQTETERSIIFTTDNNLVVNPPQLNTVICLPAAENGATPKSREINLRRLAAGFEGMEVFSATPKINDALYLGFENDLSQHILGLELDFDSTGGAGIDPTQPPYLWEVSTGEPENPWVPCEVDTDTTQGMNTAGSLRIHLPKMGVLQMGERSLFWVRVRIKEISRQEAERGMRAYIKSPMLRSLLAAAWGGTVTATHSQQVRDEYLGRSDGSAGQRFQLQVPPILQRRSGENLILKTDGQPPQTWSEVSDFAESGFEDTCYTLDGTTGELRFGPAVRQPDGTMKLYGAIPARGASLFFSCYRYGGGERGNISAGLLNTLKTSIPYIAKVSNRQMASGGLDAESLEDAMLRAPVLLRSHGRAVNEADYEFLTMQALPQAVGRVKCLQPRALDSGKVIPGQIYVLVVPRVPRPEEYLTPEQLELSSDTITALKTYLDERRLLTTRLDVRSPAYQWVKVKVKLRAIPGANTELLQAEVLRRLFRFINPLTGGPDEKGWPFDRDLFVSDVYQCLQGTTGIQFVQAIEMYKASPSGAASGGPIESLEVLAHSTIASGKHEIEWV
jgi:predicted phage baseplate assembly protein